MTALADDDLEALLSAAASAAPSPSAGMPRLVDPGTVSGKKRTTRSRRPPRWLAVAAAAAAALLGGSMVLDENPTGPATDQAQTGASESRVDEATGPPAVDRQAADGDDGASRNAATVVEDSAESDLPGFSPGSGAIGTSGAAGTEAAGSDGARIAKDGAVEIEVERGGFDATAQRVSGLATGLGGYVSATRTTESGDAPSGTVTLRVPVAAFEDLLEQVRRLGDVRSVTTSASDVTAQYTDLEARLGALAATRGQLLTILGEAQAIPDVLAVQDRLNVVQIEIESLEGQRRVLADQSELASLAVTLLEPGAAEAAPVVETGDGGLGGAWDDARRGFGDALEWILSRTGGGLVVGIAGLAALVAVRTTARRLRRATI